MTERDVLLSVVCCNRCDRIVDMDAEFTPLKPDDQFVCPCGSDVFAFRARDEDGELVDVIDAHLTRGNS